MKVKVTYVEYVTKEIEIDDKFKPLADWNHCCSDEECDEATKEVERIMGMPFGDDDYTNAKYIVGVNEAETDNPMLEW